MHLMNGGTVLLTRNHRASALFPLLSDRCCHSASEFLCGRDLSVLPCEKVSSFLVTPVVASQPILGRLFYDLVLQPQGLARTGQRTDY